MPSEFPANVDGLGRSSPDVLPPSFYQLDLLLWDIHTMSASPEDVTPIQIEAWIGDNPSGVRIVPEPLEGEVPGGIMEYGSLTIGLPFDNPSKGARLVPEGTIVPFSIAVVDPRFPNEQCWEQDGRAIQDLRGPLVQTHSVVQTGDRLAFSITASDAVTTVLAANFYYSLDGGSQWSVQPLTPRIDPLDDPSLNTFDAAVFVNPESNASLQYFFNVQDGVLNDTWFGVGSMQLFPDCNQNGLDDTTEIANGTQDDVNADGIPDDCQVGGAEWIFIGTAQGGTVSTTVQGFFASCTVTITTMAGDSATTVAADFAAALSSAACLLAQDITATASGNTVTLRGFLLGPQSVTDTITDPGLQHLMPIIPALSPSGLVILVLLTAAFGMFLLSRLRSGSGFHRQ